jgi:hypothetical protein
MQICAEDRHVKLQGLRSYGPSIQSVAVYSTSSIQLHLSNHSPLFCKLGTPNPKATCCSIFGISIVIIREVWSLGWLLEISLEDKTFVLFSVRSVFLDYVTTPPKICWSLESEDKRTMNDKSVKTWLYTAMDSFKIPSRQCLKELRNTKWSFMYRQIGRSVFWIQTQETGLLPNRTLCSLYVVEQWLRNVCEWAAFEDFTGRSTEPRENIFSSSVTQTRNSIVWGVCLLYT